MRVYLYIVVIVFLSSCSILKKNNQVNSTDSEQKDYSEVEVNLSNEEQRKFDYYFYEGNRFKALGEINKSFMYFSEALEIDSTCSSCAFEISKLLLHNESYEEAEKLMQKAVRFSPDNPYYIRLLSRLYQNNNKGKKAVLAAEQLIKNGEPSVEDLYFVAQVQLENGMFKEAVANLQEIEKKMGIKEGLVIEKYQILYENEDYKSAKRELEKLIETYPENYDFRIYLGDFYIDREDYKKAFAEFENVLDNDPNNGKVHFSLANYYIAKEDTSQFKKSLKKGFSSGNIEFEAKIRRFLPFVSSMDNSDNPLNEADIEEIFEIFLEMHPYENRIYGAYGNYLTSKGENNRAIEIFEKGLEMDASKPEIWQEYLFLISTLDDNNMLLEKSSEAVKFFPDEPLFRFFKGIALFENENFSKSADTLERGLKEVEDNPELKGRFHNLLGDIYFSLEKYEDCFSHYEKALEIDENNVGVLNNYSYYLAVQGKNLDKAEKMSSRTIELDPGNATFLDTYAWVLFKKERYNEAKFIIERAIDNMEEPNGVIVEHYGDILFKNGDLEGALEQWNKALELKEHSDNLEWKIKYKKFKDESTKDLDVPNS
ncbi:MAG: tetratricopeptide repeat protein [bacterium]